MYVCSHDVLERLSPEKWSADIHEKNAVPGISSHLSLHITDIILMVRRIRLQGFNYIVEGFVEHILMSKATWKTIQSSIE